MDNLLKVYLENIQLFTGFTMIFNCITTMLFVVLAFKLYEVLDDEKRK